MHNKMDREADGDNVHNPHTAEANTPNTPNDPTARCLRGRGQGGGARRVTYVWHSVCARVDVTTRCV